MKPEPQTEYIVQCLRDAGSMYEKDARAFLAEHDGHVHATALREAADLAEQRTGGPAEQHVLLDFATQLRRAASVREKATAEAATVTVRAVVHAALRTVQGGLHHLGLVTLEVLTDRVTEAVTPLVTGSPATTTDTDFFQPGHTYTHRNGTGFKCVAVTTHPQTGERLAMGWHVDSWTLHYPATVGINQWNHEYDGAQPPTSTEGGGRG